MHLYVQHTKSMVNRFVEAVHGRKRLESAKVQVSQLKLQVIMYYPCLCIYQNTTQNYLEKKKISSPSAISYYTLYEYQTVNFSSFHKTFASSITLQIPKCFMFNLTVYHTINFDFVFRVCHSPLYNRNTSVQYSWLYH